MIDKRLGHRVAFAVEDAKIVLSAEDDAAVSLDFIEHGLAAAATRAGFERAIRTRTDRLHRTARDCIAAAGLDGAAIDTDLPHRRLEPRAGRARSDRRGGAGGTAGDGSDLLSVASGLTQMAGRMS